MMNSAGKITSSYLQKRKKKGRTTALAHVAPSRAQAETRVEIKEMKWRIWWAAEISGCGTLPITELYPLVMTNIAIENGQL